MHTEEATTFTNPSGQTLIGVWHGSATPSDYPAIIMLHGWSGYRSGPHQMLTRAARRFAASGFPVLRFDFAGRGDSEGDAELATLATMAQDAGSAVAHARGRHQGSGALLLGLCSGCEVALATAAEAAGAGLAGVALWSAPVFAASGSAERTTRKRRTNLASYARKLLRPATYVKLLTGQVDTRSVRKVMTATGGEAKNLETGEPGQLPPGWRARCLQGWKRLHLPALLVYGTADPTATEAEAWFKSNSAGALATHRVAGANHSYYGLGWEEEVLSVTLEWLLRLPATSPAAPPAP